MKIKLLKSNQDYLEALERIDSLLGSKEGSKEVEELELLSILVESYEEKHYPILPPDPIEAIRFTMDQLGLKRKDLEPLIGSRGKVSDILNKKRNLTLSMIRKINQAFKIPAEILIQETNKKRA